MFDKFHVGNIDHLAEKRPFDLKVVKLLFDANIQQQKFLAIFGHPLKKIFGFVWCWLHVYLLYFGRARFPLARWPVKNKIRYYPLLTGSTG